MPVRKEKKIYTRRQITAMLNKLFWDIRGSGLKIKASWFYNWWQKNRRKKFDKNS